jgi:hypothetical protein
MRDATPTSLGGSLVAVILTAAMLTASSTVIAADACQAANLITPGRGSTIPDARPLIEWEALPNQDQYRVRLRSRVPEGEVVVSLDAVVQGTQFRPPRTLTDFHAVVWVTVTGLCDGQPPVADDDAAFYVNTGPLCPLGPLRDTAEPAETIIWSPVSGAIEYESFFYEMPDSKLVERTASRESSARIPAALRRPAVVATRAKCATGFGELRYLVLP